MEDLSLHILDIVENSIRAGASEILITIIEDYKANLFILKIKDDGKGMSEEELNLVKDPFYTTKSCRRVGLGVPLLAQAARACNGNLEIKTEKGKGSILLARFQHDHIDRQPLGDITKTLTVLIASSPEINFTYTHKRGDKSYVLDTKIMKKELDGVPINTPAVIKIIKNDINKWLN